MRNYGLEWVFKLEDLWFGVFWKPGHVWICIIPCFPIHIYKKVDLDQLSNESLVPNA